MNVFLPYLNSLMDTFEQGTKKCDDRITELIREFYEETPKLPRKLKKKRRKELNREYSFLMSIRDFTDLNSYSFY